MTERDGTFGTAGEGDSIPIETETGVYFVTSNDEKYETATDVFGPEIPLDRYRIDVPEIQSTDPKRVVERKAETAYTAVDSPVLVDDFSFFMDGLNGFPGPLVKHLLSETGLKGLRGLSRVAESGCAIQCTVALCDGKECVTAAGTLSGTLSLGSEGADPTTDMPLGSVFIPDGYDRPLAQLHLEDHRRSAYRELKEIVTG